MISNDGVLIFSLCTNIHDFRQRKGKLLCQKIRENSLISEVIRIPGKVVYRESAFYEKKKTQ